MFVEIENMKFYYFFILLLSFSFSSYANINQPYGLFFVKENKLKSGQDIFEAPTLKTDVAVDVQGLLSTTIVKQYFINPTNTHMEAIYLFPLPEKSAVDHLRMKIGDRYIDGVIKEKEEAEETYEKAKKQGKKASLVSSSRSNIFKTKLANIAPGEMIIIEIRYHDKLVLEEGAYNLRIPTVIQHRYGFPTKWKINTDGAAPVLEIDKDIHSPINDKEYSINPYSVSVDLNTGFNISSPQSDEALNINKISSSHFTVSLANGTMPSTKDFIVSFKPILSPDPYVQIYGEEVGEDLYLYGLINPQIKLSDLHLADKLAITIVADVSGSMSGNSLRKMKTVLKNFINQLPEHYHLNIIAFNDYHFKLFRAPKVATQNIKYQALSFVKKLKAENGTNMMPAVYEALFEKISIPVNHQIVLMTDGAITSERSMMALVNEHIGNKRFNVVGIGSAPNSFLITNLAKAGRGSYLYVNTSDLVKKSEDLLYKINRPIIENLQLVLPMSHEMLPKRFPDILVNEPITFFLKLSNTKKTDLDKPFSLRGNKLSRSWKFEIHPNDIQVGNNLNQLWAREKIAELMFHNAIGKLDTGTNKKKVTRLALEHSLVTEFTSLVAVDHMISRNANDPLKTHQIAQNLVEGWEEPGSIQNLSFLEDLIDPNSISSPSIQNLLQMPAQALQLASPEEVLNKIDLNTNSVLQIQFVQTSTNKYFYFILAGILFVFSLTLFRFRRRFY